jgi:hypothetical protein
VGRTGILETVVMLQASSLLVAFILSRQLGYQ